MTSSRLAELLETQPSSISHLLSGRNKPSFDLIQKILRRFPRINPDWLLLDSERMFRNDASEFTAPALFADDNPNESSAGTDSTEQEEDTSAAPPQKFSSRLLSHGMENRSFRQVILLYDDGTCENYRTRE
ncbi:helix-turn-helix domain-containing protein [Alistipes sp.]|uniref:helix-turn-helix domain-containing protein n=1 Tax=Alistipes sp. TaxID=1872444 RepID=UPI003AABE968